MEWAGATPRSFNQGNKASNWFRCQTSSRQSAVRKRYGKFGRYAAIMRDILSAFGIEASYQYMW